MEKPNRILSIIKFTFYMDIKNALEIMQIKCIFSKDLNENLKLIFIKEFFAFLCITYMYIK
jgi:hypothetical protein